MQANILCAIRNITGYGNSDLRQYSTKYLNRINAAGEQLEFYLKDAFANSFTLPQDKKEEKYTDGSIFSYLGNQNNPPDVILAKGDAFEIKKIKNASSNLALNSSPPKDRLHSNDTRITEHCRKSDGGNWAEKDLFYVVGHVSEGTVKHIFFVHGRCYAAEREVYERISKPIKREVSSILTSLNLETAETNELGKVKRVDPLGITELRIRGMWHIQNPVRVFSGICPIDESKRFSLIALMTKEKYGKYPKSDIAALEQDGKIKVSDVKIKDPNNPAKTLDAKLIVAKW